MATMVFILQNNLPFILQDSYAATEALLAYYRYLNTQGVSTLSSAQLTEVAESQLFNVSLPAHTTILAQVSIII